MIGALVMTIREGGGEGGVVEEISRRGQVGVGEGLDEWRREEQELELKLDRVEVEGGELEVEMGELVEGPKEVELKVEVEVGKLVEEFPGEEFLGEESSGEKFLGEESSGEKFLREGELQVRELEVVKEEYQEMRPEHEDLEKSDGARRGGRDRAGQGEAHGQRDIELM